MADEMTPLVSSSDDTTNGAPRMNKGEQASSRWTRNQKLVVICISLQNLANGISFSIISPFYANEAAKKGASSLAVGFVFGVFHLIIFLTSPIYGSFIQKIGAKYMFISGSFILGGCSICFGFLDDCPDGLVYVAMCFLCRSVEANGCSMLVTAAFAIMAKTFPDDIGKITGTQEMFVGLGMVLGPSIGGGLYTLGGFKLPFLVMGSVIWTITLICLFVLPIISDVTRVNGNFLSLLMIPDCIVIYPCIISCAIALTFLGPTFSPFMIKTFPHLSVAEIGLIFMIWPGSYGLSAPVAGILTDKGWLATPVIFGTLSLCIATLILGPAPFFGSFLSTSLPGIIVTLVVLGLSVSFSLIPLFPMVYRAARYKGFDDSLQTLGLVSGLFNSGFSLGGFIGPTAAGALDEKLGFSWSSTICGFLILFVSSIFTCYVILKRIKKQWPIPSPAKSSDRQTSIQDSAHPI